MTFYKNKSMFYALIKPLICGLLFLNSLNLIWFIFFRYQQLAFNSDSAIKVLLAKEIFDSGSYFPKDWVYANQDLWVLSWHTLIIPLLNFFPAGYTVHAIVGLIAYALVLLSLWLVLSVISISSTMKLMVMTVFASGISLTLTENLYGQYSYGTIFVYYCLIIYSSWKILEFQSRSHLFNSSLLFLLLFALSWANPLRSLIYYVGPLIGSILFYAIRLAISQQLNFKLRSIIKLFLICFLSVSAGVLFNKVTIHFVQMNEGVTQLRWISLDDAFKNITKIFQSMLFILGGEPYPGRSVYTVSGIYDGFRMIVAICFIGLIPVSLIRVFKRQKNDVLTFLSVFSILAFCIISFLMLTTNIYNGRYILPAVLLFIFIVLAQDVDFKSMSAFNLTRVFVIVGFLTNILVVNTSYWSTYHASSAHQDDYQQYDQPYELAQFLSENKLKYGYATYWNASAITVLTNNQIIIGQIYFKDGVPIPLKWLSVDRLYQPENYQGESFLLVNEKEAKLVNWPYITEHYGLSPFKTLKYKNFFIYIFHENISSKLLNWKK